MSFSHADSEVLRRLAGDCRRVADSPENLVRRQLLTDLNALRPQRPVVLCFPEGGWPELVDPEACQCVDPLARQWELHLRSVLFARTVIRDDNAIEPTFCINWMVEDDGFGVDADYAHGANRGSYTWTPPLKQLPEDLDKLRLRRPRVDRDETRRRAELAAEVFGDLLEVRITGRMFFWTCGLTSTAIRLIGLEQLMLAMFDQPEGLHALMKWLSDEMLAYSQWFADEGLYTLNNTDGYVGSGGSAYSDQLPGSDYKPGDKVELRHLWGFAESQETVGVSPEMFAEFVLPYQLPLLERFGLNCYGCCEPVDQRWEHIRKIPRLRRVSVSPWCKEEVMAATLGKDYVYSRKPNPSLICCGYNEPAAAQDVRRTLELAGRLPLEIILKDTHTFENDPTRPTRWVEMVRREMQTAGLA